MNGLTPPEWQREDCKQWAGPHWNFFKEALEMMGHVDSLIYNGDAIDGPGKKDTQYHITTDVGTQIKMAEVIARCFDADRIHVVKGTGFHTDGNTAYEDWLGAALGVDAQDELRLDVYGRKIHARHVVGRSDIPYGQQTQMQRHQQSTRLLQPA